MRRLLDLARGGGHRRGAWQLSNALSEIAQELNLAPDLDTALELVLKQMERVIAFDSGSIMLLEGDKMRVVAVGGFDRPELVLGAQLDLKQASLNREVVETRRPLIIGRATLDARWFPAMGDADWSEHLGRINSWIGVPLLIRDRVIGMLTADKFKPDSYRPEDAELAMIFASHAAIAIENARLLDSERAQLRLAQTLQEMGALLTTRLSLDELFEHIFDLLARVVAYDSVSIQLLDEHGRMGLVAGRGLGKFVQSEEIVHLLAAKTMRQQWGELRVLVIPDTHADNRWVVWSGSEYIRSWIGAALMVKDRVVGVLNVDSARVNAYDQATGETVAAFANQAAAAIENARLYERSQQELISRGRAEKDREQLLADLERRSNRLRTAAQVSTSASTILDPELLMDRTVNLILERFGFYYVGIFLVDDSGARAFLRAATGSAGRQMLEANHNLVVGGDSMIGQCIAQARARVALDVGREKERFENPILPETRSEMALPLVSRGKCIGALTVQCREENAFSDEDVAALQTMADQLAIAIENARLYEAAQHEIRKRRQAEEEIIRLYESMERRVVERTAELAAVNQELEAFSYSVSHDLRAPLRRVISFSRALQEDFVGQLDQVAEDYFQRMDAASQQMMCLIDALLNLSRLSRQEMHRELVDLSSLARAIATELEQTEPERSVEFVIADGLAVRGDARLLQLVLDNLFSNAWKFTAGRAQAKIEFGALGQEEKESVYFVRDNGAGFDMDYADRLFAAFKRLHSAAEYEGTGIGLATVQRIVHRHGGRVWAQGAVDQGATFYFALGSGMGTE